MSPISPSELEIKIAEIKLKLNKQQELNLDELKILLLSELQQERIKENNS